MQSLSKLTCTTILLGILTACGGGGGGGEITQQINLSKLQQNFENSAVLNTASTLDWNVPTTNTAATNGVHSFFERRHAFPSSPRLGLTERNLTFHNLSSLTTSYDTTRRSVLRTIEAGQIRFRNASSKTACSYIDDIVRCHFYSNDGGTILSTTDLFFVSEPTSLSGLISNSTELKSWLSFLKLNTPTNLNFSINWNAGSSYRTIKERYTDDVLIIRDWPRQPTTFDNQVSPYPGSEASIEDFFNGPNSTAAAGFVIDGITYTLAQGSITNIKGVRAWVATTKRPSSASATDERFCIVELNGRLYTGGIRFASTVIRYIDQLDSTIIRDDTIFLNSGAIESIKKAILF